MREVLVYGASGYTGAELLRWLGRHPHLRLAGASSDRFAGQPIARLVPELGGRFEAHDRLELRSDRLVFLATPAETSIELAPRALAAGAQVIDLSGAFRLGDAALYPEWYGFTHPRPDLLAEASYGLPERSPPRGRLVANPGCYATAAILSIAPLLELAEPGPIAIDGKSGTTGAGRKSEESLSFSEVEGTIRPYRIGRHQHVPEIERQLGVQVVLTPHLIPIRRGLVTTTHLRARPGVTQADLDRAYERYRGGLVRPTEPVPEPGPLAGTPFCDVKAVLEPRTRLIVALGAIDNLAKGAATQAIQNANLIEGLPGETGLLPEGA